MHLNFFYVNSLLLLFINFYLRTYVMRQRRGKTDKKMITSNSTKVVSNGTEVIGNGTVHMPLEDKKHI